MNLMNFILRLMLFFFFTFGFLLILTFLLGFFIQVIRLIQFERSLDLTFREKRIKKRLLAFRLTNPYNSQGDYWKGQLHLHTSEYSRDAKIKKVDVIKAYKSKGYNFLVITDHNHRAIIEKSYIDDMLIIPGSEDTYPYRLLGHHILRINVKKDVKGNLEKRIFETHNDGGISALAHPSWRGGLGTGRWLPLDIPELNYPLLIEIASRFSNSIQENVNLWHYLLNKNKCPSPVWAIGSDDYHYPVHLNSAWVMVKANSLTTDNIIESLRKGSFYASTGPEADFGLEGQLIYAHTKENSVIRFINSNNRVVKAEYGKESKYKPFGNEGFIRIEIENDKGKIAWSQPFFLIESEGEQ